MYKCNECGHIFDEGEQATWREPHGLDFPPYEEWSGCPICGGGYEKTIRCDICGAEHFKRDLKNGICRDCEKNALTFENFVLYLDESGFSLDDFANWYKEKLDKEERQC